MAQKKQIKSLKDEELEEVDDEDTLKELDKELDEDIEEDGEEEELDGW